MTENFIDTLFRKRSLKGATCEALLILPIPPDDEEVRQEVEGRPIWEWSARVGKNEGVKLVVCSREDKIRERCRAEGYDIYRPKGEELVDVVQEVLPFYPCDLFILLDPRYPLRPRGLVREVMERYLLASRVASLSTPGMQAFDTSLFLQTHSLSPYPSHISFIRDGVEDETISLLLRGEVKKLYNPWFAPEEIAVIAEDKPEVTREAIELVLASDLRVKVGEGSWYPLEGVEYDLTMKKGDLFPWREENATLGNELSEFAQAVAYFRLLYPNAHILYSGTEGARISRLGHINQELLRDWKVRGETMFWENVRADSSFSCLDSPYAGEKVEKDWSFLLPKRGDKVDYSLYDILFILHPAWQDRVVVDKEHLVGQRLSSGDKFIVVDYEPEKYIRVIWEAYGGEVYVRKAGTNTWKKE